MKFQQHEFGRDRAEPASSDDRLLYDAPSTDDEDTMTMPRAIKVLTILAAIGSATAAQAQHCHREGVDVTCDDGHRGVWSGDAIIWADGTRSRLASDHPSVIIGNKSSVRVGPGVFVGQGKGMVPLDDPSKARCVTLDDVSYCN